MYSFVCHPWREGRCKEPLKYAQYYQSCAGGCGEQASERSTTENNNRYNEIHISNYHRGRNPTKSEDQEYNTFFFPIP
jgi:hypothetical protein